MSFTKRTKIYLAVAAFALTGFSLVLYTKWSDEAETATFVVIAGNGSSCLLSPPVSGEGNEGALADLPLTAIKEVARIGSSALGSYLEETANDTSSKLETAELPIFLYQHLKSTGSNDLPNGLECLVIAHGVLGNLDPKSLLDQTRQRRFDPDHVFSNPALGKDGFSILQKLHFADFPLSYFQFRLVMDPSHSFFSYNPEVVYFRESIASEFRYSKKSVELTVSVSRPTSTGVPDPTANSSSLVMQTPIAFNDLMPGFVENVFDKESNSINTQRKWFSLSNLPAPDVLAKLQNSLGHFEIDYAPVNLTVTYKETAKPSMMLKFLGSALKDKPK